MVDSKADDTHNASAQQPSFYSPPPLTHHMDYQSKAEIRRAELELLRKQRLAKPKAQKLQTAPIIQESMADFEQKQRDSVKEQRKHFQVAKEYLHQYRAETDVVLKGTPEKTPRRTFCTTTSSPPDATATIYASPDHPHYLPSDHNNNNKHSTSIFRRMQQPADAKATLYTSPIDTAVTMATTFTSPSDDGSSSPGKIPMSSLLNVTRNLMMLDSSTTKRQTCGDIDGDNHKANNESFTFLGASTAMDTATRPSQMEESAWRGPVILPSRSKEGVVSYPVILPTRSKEEVVPDPVNVPTRSKQDATPRPVILPSRSKEESGPVILPSRSKENVVSRPAVLPSASKQESLPGPVILPSRSKDDALSGPVILPCRSKEEVLPGPVILPCRSKEDSIPGPVILPSRSKEDVLSYPVILPSRSKEESLPGPEDVVSRPVILPPRSKEESLPGPVILPSRSNEESILGPVILPSRSKEDVLSYPVILPSRSKEESLPGPEDVVSRPVILPSRSKGESLLGPVILPSRPKEESSPGPVILPSRSKEDFLPGPAILPSRSKEEASVILPPPSEEECSCPIIPPFHSSDDCLPGPIILPSRSKESVPASPGPVIPPSRSQPSSTVLIFPPIASEDPSALPSSLKESSLQPALASCPLRPEEESGQFLFGPAISSTKSSGKQIMPACSVSLSSFGPVILPTKSGEKIQQRTNESLSIPDLESERTSIQASHNTDYSSNPMGCAALGDTVSSEPLVSSTPRAVPDRENKTKLTSENQTVSLDASPVPTAVETTEGTTTSTATKDQPTSNAASSRTGRMSKKVNRREEQGGFLSFFSMATNAGVPRRPYSRYL